MHTLAWEFLPMYIIIARSNSPTLKTFIEPSMLHSGRTIHIGQLYYSTPSKQKYVLAILRTIIITYPITVMGTPNMATHPTYEFALVT